MKSNSKKSLTKYTIKTGLVIKFLSNKEVLFDIDGTPQKHNASAIRILETFSSPQTLEEALDYFSSKINDAQELTDIISTIYDFTHSRILVDEKETRHDAPHEFNPGFDNANIHILMLNDTKRTNLYINAIQKVIRPTDIVVEIGNWVGSFSYCGCARAGAKKVYAIEAGRKMAQLARANFKANGVEDKITLIEGWSTEVNIPEKATVLISEIIGNHPLDEGILSFTKDAQKRFLTKDARMIPSQLRLMASPIGVSIEFWSLHHFTKADVKKWENLYHIKFTSLISSDFKNLLTTPNTFISATKAAQFPTFSAPCLLANIDLFDIQSEYETKHSLTSTNNGILNGMTIFCDLELAENIILSTNPIIADKNFHWTVNLQFTQKPIHLQKGELFRLQYNHNKGIEIKKNSY